MSSVLIENGIHVNFEENCNKKCLLHFLTHIDSDEAEPSIADSVKHIYTSKFNAWLLKNKYKVDPSRIVSLPIQTTLRFSDEKLNFEFKVTLINANHTLGSVMYLFESDKFGTVLYTGHFCYNSSLFSSGIFRSILAEKKLTSLYLDVTNLRLKKELPPKRIIVKRVVDLIKRQPDHKICIFLKDLQNDNILNEIANKLNEPVYVNKDKMKMLKILNLQEGFVMDLTKARVYGLALDADDFIQVMRHNLKSNTPVLKILLTTSTYLSSNVKEIQTKGVHLFNYRTHSSAEELKWFINRLHPSEVMSIYQRDSEILQEFLKRINYQGENNSAIKRLDFWEHIGKVDKLFSSPMFGDMSPAKRVTKPLNVMTISDESTASQSKQQNNLTDCNLNCKTEIKDLLVHCDMNSNSWASCSVPGKDSENDDSDSLSCKRIQSSETVEKQLIKRGKVLKSRDLHSSPDLKETLLNLNYRVEVCNIVKSVHFLQRLGLEPTWKNTTLYKSPERLTKLIRENRRKQQNKKSKNI